MEQPYQSNDNTNLIIRDELTEIKKKKYLLSLGFLSCIQVLSYFIYFAYESDSFEKYLLFTFFAPIIFVFFAPKFKKLILLIFLISASIKVYICFTVDNINVLALFYALLAVEAINIFSLIF
jgi:hypothetical protein